MRNRRQNTYLRWLVGLLAGSGLLVGEGCSLYTQTLEMPFVAGEENKCGEAALHQILQYYDMEVDDAFLEVKSVPELLVALRFSGLHPELKEPSLVVLYRAFENDIPVIIVLSEGSDEAPLHCVVTTSIQPLLQQIHVHDGIPNKVVSFRRLIRFSECFIEVHAFYRE